MKRWEDPNENLIFAVKKSTRITKQSKEKKENKNRNKNKLLNKLFVGAQQECPFSCFAMSTKENQFSSLFFPFPVVIRKVEAVIGRNGQLACNLTSEIREDRVALVIWYKEGKTTPIYSYDARDSKAVEGGSHHGSDGKFYFNTTSINPAMFTISNLTAEDEGTYRCRVDFLRSPTKNTKVHLTVIVPPENLLILNELGKHIEHYILGPYNEGSNVNLTCTSSGGKPQPTLTWWHNNQLLNNDIVTRLSDKRVRNILQLKSIDRKNLLSSYTCQSSNNNLTDPITSSVMINLNCK